MQRGGLKMNRPLACSFGMACLMLASGALAETPAEISVRQAAAAIAKSPGHAPYYNELAMAYARRARETSDPGYYEKADAALNESFALAPDNFEGFKVRARVLLGRHEFAKALELATKLNRQMPDDIVIYGYLAEANVELGNYDEAVAAVQWMLRIRPGNAAGLAGAGYLRELHGYVGPAMEVTQMAYQSAPYQETEERARLQVRMAHLSLLAGDMAKAETYATSALALFPGYPEGLGALAEVRMAQQRYDDAAILYRKRYDEAPRAANLYAVAEALEKAGRNAEAHAAFAEFEKKAIAEAGAADNANRELVAYYADVANKPPEALRIAEEEIARRHDMFTLDAYAWALAATGDEERASIEIHKALAVGTKEPQILHHADAIAQRLHANATPGNMGE